MSQSAHAKEITSLVTAAPASVERTDFPIKSGYRFFYKATLSEFANNERCFVAMYPVGWGGAITYFQVGTVSAINSVATRIPSNISTDKFSAGDHVLEVACGGTSTSSPDLVNGDRETVQVRLHPAVAIGSFAADRSTVVLSETYSLSWVATNATSCTLDGVALGEMSGSQNIAADAVGQRSHVLSCVGAGGADDVQTNTVVVTVEETTPAAPVSIGAFTVMPASITLGQTATLSWSVENASSCTASGAWSGGKSATGGTEVVTPANAGSKTYTLTCTDGANQSVESVTLAVAPASIPPSFTTPLAVSPASITLGQSATLNWAAQNANTCTASGAWSGGKSATGPESVTPTAVGTYNYTLTCSGDGPDAESSASLTVNAAASKQITSLVTAAPASVERTDFPIKSGYRFFFTATLSGFANNERCFDAIYPVGGSPTYAYKGQVSAINSTATRFGNSTGTGNYPAGDYLFEVACGGTSSSSPDLVNGDRKTVQVKLHPAVAVGSFNLDTSNVLTGQPYSLSWTSTDAASCTIDGDPVAVTGSKTFTRSLAGEQTHTLSCVGAAGADDVQTRTLTVTVADEAAETITGKYFGQYTYIMAQHDPVSFVQVGLAKRLPGSWANARYKVMGWNHAPAWWMWDFDALNETGTGRIYLGGSGLLAMGAVRPDFRLLSPDRKKRAGQQEPDIDPPLSEQIGTFTQRSDGTYAVRFNLQIFLALADYPLAELANIMSVRVQDGNLIVTNEDGHPDGVSYFDGWDASVPALDGIPGVTVPGSSDIDPATNQARFNGVFPVRVVPSFHSATPLVKVDMTASCSGDGIPDEVKRQLGLDPCLADNDGDGIADVVEIGNNLALPKQTDRDFIPDVLKPSEFAGNPYFAGQIVLGNAERVVLYFNEPGNNYFQYGLNPMFHQPIPEDWFGRPRPFFDFTQTTGGNYLPTVHPGTGLAMNYELGMLVFNSRASGSNGQVRMYFANGVPQGLRLFKLSEKFTVDYSAQFFSRESGSSSISYQQIDAHTIEFDNPKPVGLEIGNHVFVALGHTEASRTVVPFDKNEPGYQAILQKARDWSGTTPPALDPVSITSFTPASATITLGASTQLLWNAANAESCALKQGETTLHLGLSAGNYAVTPDTVGTHTYELTCTGAGTPASKTTTVTVQQPGSGSGGSGSGGTTPANPNLITGTWTGTFSMTMRVAGTGIVLGDSHNNGWTWNFDEGWAELSCGMLSVGFPFHVQDLGNASSAHDRAYFTKNGDGTYTLYHGYQIYNPYVGDPRTDMTTTFSVTRSGNQIQIVTLDLDGDGVPGLPVPNVFPLTVSPGIDGALAQDGSAGSGGTPAQCGSGGSGNGDLIGLFSASPASVGPGQSFTLTWQAVRAMSCTASGAWSGGKSTAGTESLVAPATAGTHTYTLACTGSSGSMSRSVTVQVGTGTGTPAETVTGEVADLVVGSGKTVQNNGTLVNPTNHGTIQGGTVAGTVQNDGTLADVTLAAGTTVSGGTLRGDLQGSGTVTNAIVDASSLSPDVSLGAGVRITAATAHNVPGLDLSAAVRGQDGLLDPTAPLLIAEEGAAPLTLGDLARRGIDSLFANGATHADAGAGMLVLSNSAALPGKVVPVAPAAVRTTDQPDGTALDPNGNLVVTSGGIQTTYVPVPLDPQALSNGLQVAAATVTEESADGRLLVRIGGTTFSVRVGLLATQAGEGRRTRASGGATFATAGSLADPAGYRIVAHYPDGSSQDLIPYLHDLAGFAAHIAAAGWTHAIDAVSGRITLKNAAGTVVAQGMPDYQIAPATGTPGIASAGDRNGDGLDDWLFNTGQGSQIIYNLGLPPVDPDALAGTWTGRFTLTMRTAPQGVVLGDSRDNAWTWNFDEGWAELAQGMLSVGFPFHVQDLGNASASHDRAYFTKNADGTYTLRHGYQIYNPYVGNPRIDMTTTVRITREGSQLRIVTLDPDGDGVAGIQVPGVFPLTVSPDFVGTLAQDGSADPDPGTGDPGTSPGTDLIGAFVASPTGVGLGQTATLTWQAVRATSCTASGAWSGAKATAGTESVTPATAGAQTYTLTCTAGSETMSRSVTVQVDAGGGTTNPTDPADPSGPGTTGLTGLYVGEHLITMRGCPGACAAGQEVVLGTGVKNAPWVWNFDTRTVLITGTTLSVGFNYEVQSLGNQGTGDARLTAGFTDNGDGTYTLHHGFQIYNPNVGNPRADTTTKFQISRDSANPNRIVIRTLDDEPGHSPDGIPGTQIVGVFPLTVQPDFRGDARREGGSSAGDGIPDQVKEALGLNPDAANGDTDGDGIPDATEIGPDPANPLDSDGDGVIDALEPGAAAQDARRIAGLALLGGQPGRVQEGTPLSGTTVDVQAGNGWQFTGAGTGLMQLAAADDAGAMPETTLGDAGLDYRHGYVQVRLSGSGPATLRLTYAAALPAANKLLVYATRRVEGRERYALMSKSDYRRIDDHTLEVAVQDDGAYDLDPSPGVLRTGVAPVANTLGGY